MLKLLRFVFLNILFLGLSFQDVALAESFDFSQTPKIRVYISEAPGMGHQSASVVVMRRLRQVGFNGKFEVVYADAIANKLPSLLQGFDPQVFSSQTLADVKIQAISESHFFRQNVTEPVDFAVTGADDNRTHMTPEKLNARRYLLMEPLGWGDSLYFEVDRPPRVLTSLRSLGYRFDIESHPSAIESSIQAIEKEGHTERARGLRLLMKTDSHMATVYGIGTIPLMTVKMRIWIESLQKASRSLNLKKPIIVPIISPQNNFERLSLEYALEEIQFPKGIKRKPTLKILDVSDPHIEQTLKSLRGGDVLLVNVGRIPQILFENLFQKSDLPVLVAGKNAMNLAQNLGKVYLNTVGDSSLPNAEIFKGAIDQSLRAHRVFLQASNSDRDLRHLVQFVKDASGKDSTLRQMHQTFLQNNLDKVVEALRLLKFPEAGAICGAVFQ